MDELSFNDKKSIFQKYLLAETLKRIDEETADLKEYKRISFKNAKKMSSILGFSVHWRPSAKQVIAILVAAAMLLLTGCGIAYRNEIRDFIIKNRGKGVSISFSEDPETEIKPIGECYNLDFIPEGFSLEQITQIANSIIITWLDADEHFIKISIIPTDKSIIGFDSERGYSEIKQISSIKVYCHNNDKVYCYLWNDGNYSFVADSNFNIDDDLLISIMIELKK